MSKAVAVKQQSEIMDTGFTPQEMNILQTSICKGLDSDQLSLFIYVCKHTGLNPFMKQIFAVPRKDIKASKEQGKEVFSMTIQTSIDGYRLIADRTGCYIPGREPTFEYDKSGKLLKATAYLKKKTADGTWHEVSASAFYSEYVQCFKDYNTQQMIPTKFWQDMPHNQLAKCAESLLIRKSFPAECSGVYTKEEMEQADNEDIEVQVTKRPKQHTVHVKQIEMTPDPIIETVTQEQADTLGEIISQCSDSYKASQRETLKVMNPPVKNLNKLPLAGYEAMLSAAMKNRAEHQASLAKADSEEVA